MKRVLVLVLLLAAVGGVTWWISRPSTDGPQVGDATTIEGPAADAPDAATGPLLAHKGAVPKAKPAAKGRGAIVGTVRRAGAPVPARVEVRFVQDVTKVSMFGRYGPRYFERMLLAPNASLDVLATATAGADGRFEVDGLGTGAYDVTAIAEDGARGSVSTTIPADGARVEANPVVSGGSETLKGRVTHADGGAWQGQVLVERGGSGGGFDPGGLRGVLVEVDAEGRFAAGGLEPGQVSVTAIVPGTFRATGKPVTIPFAGEYLLVVDAGSAVLKGRVVADADGSPVAGAVVLAGGRGGDLQMTAVRATSDAEGRFEVTLPSGPGSGMYVSAEGFAPSLKQNLDAASKDPLEVRLVRGATVRGRVTRESDGGPAAGLTVRVVAIGQNDFPFGGDGEVTDADGRYQVVDLPGGEAMAYAEGPGFITKGVRQMEDRGYNPLAIALVGGQTTVADLLVVPAAKAEGTVTDASGAPVAGAVVQPIPQGVNTPRSMRAFGLGGPGAATGADGRFLLDALTPGTSYSFGAQGAGYPAVQAGPFVAPETGSLTVDLRFPPQRFVDVTILDDGAGTPIAGAQIWVRGGEDFSRSAAPGAVTGADGRARVGPVPAKAPRIDWDVEGYVRGQGMAVAEGDATLTIRAVKGLEASGRVLLPDGGPAAGANVQAEPADPSQGGWVPGETAAADGTFRFRRLAAGGYTLRAFLMVAGKQLTGSASVAAGATGVSVALAAGGAGGSGPQGQTTLTVRVVDPAGKPIPRAQARHATENGSSGTNVSDGLVRFQLQAGRVAGTVEVWAARGADGAPLPLGPAKVPVPADATELEVRLPPEVRIDGVVRGSDGQPVRGVVVSATAKGREDEIRWNPSAAASTARTDASGAFHLGGLSAQEYVLQAQVPPDFVAPDPVTVNGDSKGVEIRLEGGVVATITVLDADGKPVAGATVRADKDDRGLPPGLGRSYPRTDANGVARLTGLSASRTYRFMVQTDRPDAFPEDRGDWKPRDETVRLKRAYSVKGVVRDLQGRPVARANVRRRVGENGWNGVQTDEQGVFTISQLPAGEVVLQAGLDHMDEKAGPVTVQAGAQDVVLTIDVGVELVVRVDNWPAGAQRWISMNLSSGPPENRRGTSAQMTGDGVFKFRGLAPDDECSVYLPPVADGWTLLQGGLKPGGEVRVHLQQGKTITGRLRLPVDAKNANVWAGQGIGSLGGTVAPDGRFTMPGAADGTWKVTASAQSADGKIQYHAEGEVVAGGSIDLELKPNR